MSDHLGATPADWWTLTAELGLAEHVLPCVPYAPDVRVQFNSALEGKVGKIPSVFNSSGEAHGILAWQKKPILPAEVALWRKDPRLNACVRTGKISGVGAIDVDVDDAAMAAAIAQVLYDALASDRAPLHYRKRGASPKLLVPFRMPEGARKRIIETVHGRIEMLGDGQQFVAAGTHSSGARYVWSPAMPSELPTLTLPQLDAMWDALKQFSIKDEDKLPKPATPPAHVPAPTSKVEAVTGVLTSCDEDSWKDLLSALRFMLNQLETDDAWTELGYSLLSLKTPHTGRDLWLDFCRKNKGHVPGVPEAWWAAHANAEPRTDYRHVFTMARAKGWGRSSDPAAFPPVVTTNEAATRADDTDSRSNGVGGNEPQKRIIQVADAALPLNIQEMSEVMHEEVYTQGANLTRVVAEAPDEEFRKKMKKPRAAPPLRLSLITPGWARVRLMKLALFTKQNQYGDWRPCSPPTPLVNVWLEQGDWPTLRPLDAIARAPFVRDDGSICDTEGYDTRSRTIYAPSCVYPAVPESPTRDDALRALDGIRAVFDQFPWDTPASESAFLAHILSEAARLAIDRCPMFWYTAPSAGTGKSLLSEMPAIIVHGAEPALRPWVQNGDELRKTLFASLLAGDRSIAFDNVPTGHKARAPELCAFLTSAVWKDRKLGVSETHAIPNRAVVSASGNNVTPVSDLARRCLVVRLDANTERLKERTFKIKNLREHVMQHRAQLLVNALTVIRAYHLSERAEILATPSFEPWSRMVREPLMWLGLPDPCETQSETDDESGYLGHTFALLVTHFAGKEFTAQDIAGLAGGITDNGGELSSLLIHGGCSEPNSQLKVGYWLRGERGKVSGGYKLVNVKRDRTGTMKWKFIRPGEELA